MAATKKRIALAAVGSRGDVQPYIVLGLALAARGHDVTVACEGRLAPLVQEFGLRAALLAGDSTGVLFEPAAQEALLGYRGAPQSDEERRVAEELLAWIRQGDQIARLESPAPCTFLRALVQAPALEVALHRTVLPPGQSASQSDITVRATCSPYSG